MYTGIYYSHLLVLCKCETISDIYRIPYKYRHAKQALKPEAINWFHTQLQDEDKHNEELKKKRGSYDPLYEQQQEELQIYLHKFNAHTVRDLLMKLYDHFFRTKESMARH